LKFEVKGVGFKKIEKFRRFCRLEDKEFKGMEGEWWEEEKGLVEFEEEEEEESGEEESGDEGMEVVVEEKLAVGSDQEIEEGQQAGTDDHNHNQKLEQEREESIEKQTELPTQPQESQTKEQTEQTEPLTSEPETTEPIEDPTSTSSNEF
jgi:hypothetical protein